MTKTSRELKITNNLHYYNKKGGANASPFLFLCVGHDTNLTGTNPVAGIYRQAKRKASRCQ